MTGFLPIDLIKRLGMKLSSQFMYEWCDLTNKPFSIQVGHWHINHSAIAPHFCYKHFPDKGTN